MSLTLYNTLTRDKAPFEPIDENNVRMYVCGPTVYDFAHIGNARPVIVFDVLFRLLRQVYGENKVTYVRNITDVDDKINARASRDFPDLPLNEAIRKVTEKTADQFHKDMAALGCLEPTHEPRATDFVLPRADGRADMASMIKDLISKGHAYIAEGSQGREVLFSVSSMPDYGKLSRRPLDEQKAGARIAVEAHKQHPADFVLWKESAENEPGWDATFDGVMIHGRPGWHIECSAMSRAYLGETFDIHGGGLDLIFPHHENEIAQSRCCHGNDAMANVWMHNGFLQVEGRKMSKSEGNFITVHDVLHTEKVGGRKWPGEVVRFAMLMTHYREPIDFSVRRLEEAEAMIAKWPTFSGLGIVEPAQPILDALSNDIDTPTAAQLLHSMARDARRGDQSAARILGSAAALLGFQNKKLTSVDFDPSAQINKRLTLIAEKNWAEADRIRDELLEQGIQLKDGKDPETGERVTTWEVKR